GDVGIGHDRRRIGVDQDDAVALFAQGLAGLGPRIVELAGLADNDRSSPDDEDGFDVCAFGHKASRAASARQGKLSRQKSLAFPNRKSLATFAGNAPGRAWILLAKRSP